MTEHERPTSRRRPRFTITPDTYATFAARCWAEGMEPMSPSAWEMSRHPMTSKSMIDAWDSIFRRKPRMWRRTP